MVKGRMFIPSRERDGIWFSHNNNQQQQQDRLSTISSNQCRSAVTREGDTSTGSMLVAPFNPRTAAYPPSPPRPFVRLATANGEISRTGSNPGFNFTEHDNRHSFQGSGEYFGNGRDERILGKRMFSQDLRHTGTEFLKHRGRQNVDFDYDTMYVTNYKAPSAPRDAVSAPATSYRRFGKTYARNQPIEKSHISNESDVWHEFDAEGRAPPTSLHVLAAAQHKNWLLGKRQPTGMPLWKHSYHPVKPATGFSSPYDRAQDPWWLRVGAACESGI